MSIIEKLLITYAAISMPSALAYVVIRSFISSIADVRMDIFALLWLGPLGLVLIIFIPIGLYILWSHQ